MRLRANLFCVLVLDHLNSELYCHALWGFESAYEQLADTL